MIKNTALEVSNTRLNINQSNWKRYIDCIKNFYFGVHEEKEKWILKIRHIPLQCTEFPRQQGFPVQLLVMILPRKSFPYSVFPPRKTSLKTHCFSTRDNPKAVWLLLTFWHYFQSHGTRGGSRGSYTHLMTLSIWQHIIQRNLRERHKQDQSFLFPVRCCSLSTPIKKTFSNVQKNRLTPSFESCQGNSQEDVRL